jgi:hypothetical protein
MCRIEDVIDRKRSEEEGENWLAREACRRSAMLEWVHQDVDDTFQSTSKRVLQEIKGILCLVCSVSVSARVMTGCK